MLNQYSNHKYRHLHTLYYFIIMIIILTVYEHYHHSWDANFTVYIVNLYTVIMMRISCVARADVSTAEIMVTENAKTFTPMEDSVRDATKLFTMTTATNDMHQTIPALNLKNAWIAASSGMSMK